MTLLGGFAVAVNGEPVSPKAWRLRKARELVKLLALAADHRIHREQAMDALWGDREPAAAANNLHQAVHVARRALDAGAIEVRDEMLRLRADVDVDRLDTAAAEARRIRTPATYRAALSLYAGELLPENRYDDWALARREELSELASELAAELEALPSADSDRPPSLPADASSFIGRGRELTELGSLIRDTRLLTLAGTGGVGKTRLALELARAVEPAYPDGAALVELAEVTDARLVPDTIAAALDLRALSGQSVVDALVEYVLPRSLLLVLDNCEHLLPATAGLADTLLRNAPRLTLLTTSREALRVPGEVVFRVPSLDIADPEQTRSPHDLERYEAVRLFVARGVAARPGFVLDEENAVDVARICFRLDGLPLALELAAGRLGALGPAAIAERLDNRFRVLRTSSHASPTRQQTLKATLQWSHDLLEPDERVLFRRLAAFVGGFELEAVESVCADRDLPAPGIADLLARLVEKSLVIADEESSRRRRYGLLETVRLYAHERLDEAGEVAPLAGRHARWALAVAEKERGSRRLDRDATNLRAAFDTLLESAPDDALRLCVSLGPFWLRRIDLHEAGRRFEQTLAAAPERTALRTQALLAAAAIDFRSGELARAIELAEQSHAVASEIGNADDQWRALQFLAEIAVVSDSANVAMRWLERALELARRKGFVAREAICIYSLGVAHWIRGDLARAEEFLRESVDLFSALSGSSERIPSPVNIAEVRMSRLDDRPGVRVVFEDTLQPFVEISCDAAVSYVLANQAGIARARGDLVGARALLDESAARFEDSGDEAGNAAVLVRRAYLDLTEGALGDRRGFGLALAGLGLIDTAAGDYESAERHLAEARDLFRRAGDRWALASTLWRTADLAFALGNLDDAEAALLEARTVLVPTQRERWIANTLAGLAEVALLRGDEKRAFELLTDARGRYAARHDAVGAADAQERLRALAKGL